MRFKIMNTISNILEENATYRDDTISQNYLLMIWIIQSLHP